MLDLLPLVVKITYVCDQDCPDMWNCKESELLQAFRIRYGISDRDLSQFDLVFVL